VSTTEVQVPPAPEAAARAPFLCPRCNTPLRTDQDWCLNCGTGARTAIAATPNWRLPLVTLAVVAVVFLAACAWAFVELTNNDDAVKGATQAQQTTPAPTTTEPPPGG
jgi:hypothetical protein